MDRKELTGQHCHNCGIKYPGYKIIPAVGYWDHIERKFYCDKCAIELVRAHYFNICFQLDCAKDSSYFDSLNWVISHGLGIELAYSIQTYRICGRIYGTF